MFFFQQKAAYELRISDWISDGCSSDLVDDEDVLHFHVFQWKVAQFAVGRGQEAGKRLRVHVQIDEHHSAKDFAFYRNEATLAFVQAGEIARFGHREQRAVPAIRSEEHTSELQSLMRISYAVFCLKQK